MARVARMLQVAAILALGGVTARGTADDRPAGTLTEGRVIRLPSQGRVPVRRVGEFRLQGQWRGQDRHDLTGDPAKIGPNGVQDIHLEVGGLPPDHEVVRGRVNPYGDGEWQVNGVKNQFAAVLVRSPGSTTADLYVEPYRVETGRVFDVRLEFDDGSFGIVPIKGGKADPNLHMPDAALIARWVGQEKADHAGPGPAVGPDGVQDARINLARLAKKEKVRSALIADAAGPRWAFGSNPEGHNNAEFVADAKNLGEASLFFQPDRDLAGHKLEVTVIYEGGKGDTAALTAGKTDPKLAMPKGSLPRLGVLSLQSSWLGQDGTAGIGPGDVHVTVTGVPTTRAVAAAVLSDGVRGTWVFRANDRVALDTEPNPWPLTVKRSAGRPALDLFFPPSRDESKSTMTLRLVYQDGEMAVGRFSGGACDPFLRGPRPETTEAVARPGDDLGALAARAGTVRLGAGVYPLSQPLILPRPVALVGESGTVIQFTQAASDPPWTAAIKIHAGTTTLRGFAVRFVGPVRWKTDMNWGPAVIGTTDSADHMPDLAKAALVFENLDLQGPPSSKASGWDESVKLMRLKDATCGRVTGCTLHGGVIEAFEGPWTIENNTYTGTPPGTFAPAVFEVHDPHDVVARNNVVRVAVPAGKTWRFLVFTNHGYADRVEKNTIAGLGPRDDDTIPSMNAPEIILTESYRLCFEGRPAAVSPDGRLVRVPRLPGEAPRAGEVVSVLSGGGAGQYRRIAQRIEPTAYLLEEPLPRGADVLSISPGFVGEVFDGNTIDARGGTAAAGFVLAGNHFGTHVTNNRVAGAGEAFRIEAAQTETPNIWGWSHVPYLAGRFDGNTIEDSEKGALFAVQRNVYTKSGRGRVYMTIALRGNTIRWSEAFLKRRESSKAKGPLAGFVVGVVPVLDPGELLFETVDDHLDAPARAHRGTAILVNGGQVNGRPYTKTSFSLPPPTASTTGMGGASEPAPRR